MMGANKKDKDNKNSKRRKSTNVMKVKTNAGTNSGFSFLICPTPLNDSNLGRCHQQEPITNCPKDIVQLNNSLNAIRGPLETLKHTLDHLFNDLNKTLSPCNKSEDFGMLKSLYAMLTTDGTEHAFLGQVTWIVGWIDGVFGSKIMKDLAVCSKKGACADISTNLTDVRRYLQHMLASACFSDKDSKAKGKGTPAVLSPLKVYNVKVQNVDESYSLLPHWVVRHSLQAVSWVLDELERCWSAVGSGASFKDCNLNVVFQMNEGGKPPTGKGVGKDKGKATSPNPKGKNSSGKKSAVQ